MNMNRLKRAIVAIAAAGAANIANAASPDAWAELFAKANAECTKAAMLDGATVRGEPIDFEDVVLVIVEGRHPQPHMKNAPATKYCLHDKKSGKSQASEGPALASASTSASTGRTCWTESFRAQLKTPAAIGSACTAKNDEGDSYSGVVKP
jgi:hypothetical protein